MSLFVASHQPPLLPWAGFFNKLLRADTFILTAGVPWSRDGYLSRVRHNGSWLTLPVTKHNGLIKNITLADDTRAIRKVLNTVKQQAGPYKARLEPVVYELEKATPGLSLMELNIRLIYALLNAMGYEPELPRFRLDTHEPDPALTKTERLLARVGRLAEGCSTYLAGAGARGYLEPETLPFSVWFQDASAFDPEQSILQLIAHEPDPLSFITSRGKWVMATSGG